jgi:hypothetical protein
MTRDARGHLHRDHDTVGDQVLDSAVEPLGVLPHNDQIDVVVARRHARQAAHRPQSCVQIELLSERDVDRGEAASDRRRARTLERDVVLADRAHGVLRQHVVLAAVQRCNSGLAQHELDRSAGRVEHFANRVAHLRTDAIARDQNDRVLAGSRHRAFRFKKRL